MNGLELFMCFMLFLAIAAFVLVYVLWKREEDEHCKTWEMLRERRENYEKMGDRLRVCQRVLDGYLQGHMVGTVELLNQISKSGEEGRIPFCVGCKFFTYLSPQEVIEYRLIHDREKAKVYEPQYPLVAEVYNDRGFVQGQYRLGNWGQLQYFLEGVGKRAFDEGREVKVVDIKNNRIFHSAGGEILIPLYEEDAE